MKTRLFSLIVASLFALPVAGLAEPANVKGGEVFVEKGEHPTFSQREFSDGGVLTAAIFGNAESLKSLLESGGKPCDKTFDGQCAIVIAIQNQHAACARLLWEADCRDVSELSYQLSQNATPDEVRTALAKGLKAEPENDSFASPLAVAAGAGKLEIAKILVESGAGEKHGYANALASAEGNGHLELVEYLLLIGGKPDFAAIEAVVCSARSSEDFDKILDLLLEKIKLSELPEHDQHKLLIDAIFPCDPGGPELIQKLIASGLNPKAKNKEGKSVKEVAEPHFQKEGTISDETRKVLSEILK